MRGARGADRDRTRSTARAGTGTRSRTIRSSARIKRPCRAGTDYLEGIRKTGFLLRRGDRSGGRRRAGRLGEPIYGKLDGDLARALMSINAVKGVEIGDGFAAAALTGEENADEMRAGRERPQFLSNHAGGILGGISTGQAIVARFAVKPTSSILHAAQTIDIHGNEHRDRHQRPARSLRRHPRRAGRRGDDGLRAGRSPAAPPRFTRRLGD